MTADHSSVFVQLVRVSWQCSAAAASSPGRANAALTSLNNYSKHAAEVAGAREGVLRPLRAHGRESEGADRRVGAAVR